MGGVAIKIHATDHPDIYERLGRAPGDLDFMGYGRHSSKISKIMESLGYEPNQQLNAYHGNKRQLWYFGKNQIDVLFDIFEMCHVVDFRSRLELDKPTITPADLFLQKIQIIKINEKDVKDLFVLLLEHEFGEDDKDRINLKYITKLLSEDWGFWYTTTINLEKLNSFLPNYPQFTEDERKLISSRVHIMDERIKNSPKSFRWKIRDRVGPRTSWYNEVEEVIR